MLDLHLYGPADHDPDRINAVRSIVGDRPMLSAECGGPSMHYKLRYVPEDHFMAVVKRNLEVDLHQTEAEARFNGVIVASQRSGVVSNQPYPRFFVLKLRKEDGHWRVSQYAVSYTHLTLPTKA